MSSVASKKGIDNLRHVGNQNGNLTIKMYILQTITRWQTVPQDLLPSLDLSFAHIHLLHSDDAD